MRSRRTPTTPYLIGAVALAVAVVGEGVLAGNSVWSITAAAIAALSLAWVRVAPVPVAAVVLISYAAAPSSGTTVLSVVPFFVALAFVGRFATLGPAIGVAVGSALVLGLTDVEGTDSLSQVAANVTYYLLMSVVLVGGGQLLQHGSRREADLAEFARGVDAEAAEREAAAQASERARMARELHDVVAHALTVVGVHAAVARTNLRRDPARAAVAVDRIEEAASQASDEMRRLLGLLRHHSDGPLPRLARIADLAAESGAAGVPVHLDVDGLPPDLPAGLDLAGYRIVQEALSNVRRHAPGSTATVRVTTSGDTLLVSVTDTGGGPSTGGGSGNGLVGMRERASLYGGSLDAGPLPGGGFRVLASLPLGEPAGRPETPGTPSSVGSAT